MVDEFLDLFLKATASIPELYFQLPVAGKDEPIYRERAYCYELYHQLRMLLDESDDLRWFALSGEIDKQGHPIIRPCSPDLVFHRPGDMAANVAVVEVKPGNGDVEGIKKDLRTLSYFVDDVVQYQVGIHLVYGGTEADLQKFVDEFQKVGSNKLRLYWHQRFGDHANRVL